MAITRKTRCLSSRIISRGKNLSACAWNPGRVRAIGAFLIVAWLLPLSAANVLAVGPVVLVLGDSISAAYGIQREDGWVALLEKKLQAGPTRGRVVNASISGETTGGGLVRLPRALAEHTPDVVILELGGNDGLRGYPINRMRANLQRMIDLTKEAGAVPLLVGMQIPPNYGARYTASFRGTYASLAEENEIPLVPFLLEDVALKKGWMQSDGIHPTRDAQPAMLDAVWPKLSPLLVD